jgi:RNA polymerase sigma factor (sigma-70 family)
MPTGKTSLVLSYIRQLVAGERASMTSDKELLERFIARRDGAAFRALICRHGPMIFRLCRRILQSEQDAEDAFQATFLVLATRPSCVRRKDSLGNWLYGVAQHLARKAKTNAARRRAREGQSSPAPAPDPFTEITVREAQEIFHQELGRLPEKYRAPVVLCCLEGLARDEAARQIGLPLSTLKSRLEGGRARLRARLVQRGLTLPGVLATVLVAEQAATAALPIELIDCTVKAATLSAAGAATTSVVSAKVAALTEGMVKSMFLAKLLPVTTLLLVACALGAAGAVGGSYQTQAAGQTEPPGIVQPKADQAVKQVKGDPETAKLKQEVERLKKGVQRLQDKVQQMVYVQNVALAQAAFAEKLGGAGPKAKAGGADPAEVRRYLESQPWALQDVDLKKNTISVKRRARNYSGEPVRIWDPDGRIVPTNLSSVLVLQALPLAKGAEITLDGKDATLDDLKQELEKAKRGQAKGVALSLEFTPGQSGVARIYAAAPTFFQWPRLVRTDPANSTITVALDGQEVTLPMRYDAKVTLYTKEATFTDLRAGMSVELRLGVDGKGVAVTDLYVIGAKK